jgi:hypothetical protein
MPPRSGLERSDFVLWSMTSGTAAQHRTRNWAHSRHGPGCVPAGPVDNALAKTRDDASTLLPSPPTRRRARLPAIRGNIKFDHVTFRYRIDGPEILHDVTFEVPSGQMVSSGLPGRARARSQSLSSASTSPRADASWWTAWISPWPTPPGCADRSASSCRRTCCSTALRARGDLAAWAGKLR